MEEIWAYILLHQIETLLLAFGIILLTFSVLFVWIVLKITKQDMTEAM